MNKRTFREQEVIEALVITANTSWGLADKLNELMDGYNLIDCQYGVSHLPAGYFEYSALVIIGEKK